MEIVKIENKTFLKEKLIDFAENCSWEAGKHLAFILKENNFLEWEAVFAAVEDGEIIGFCTFLETDYYPENRYSPWISSIFVDKKFRGNKISFKLIENTIEYAKMQSFKKVYIPSDMIGFYEKCGFIKIDELVNYGGDTDNIFVKEIL